MLRYVSTTPGRGWVEPGVTYPSSYLHPCNNFYVAHTDILIVGTRTCYCQPPLPIEVVPGDVSPGRSGWVTIRVCGMSDIPLAHLITFHCHGTWLHGDDRGSSDRFHNRYKSPHITGNEQWHRYNQRSLRSAPVTLCAEQPESVERAIRETCEFRRWQLHVVNVRTNHVHVVVSIGRSKASSALNALKANATRQMRNDGNWCSERTPWADKGSQRYLWSERSVALALDYVVNGQGGDLPDFD